ncbi:MAG TPA: amidohydrolase [Candidatus Limnocylindrales bacterium]|nr:amidohydrolase [Candidatus Limnocylindrales bacterium]
MPSLAIVNGKVWSRPGATALAVDGDRITSIGTGRLDATRVSDARGAWILPAFNDAHVHFLMASRALGQLDLFGAATQAEVERRVTDYARARADAWIVGRGWLYSAFPDGMPSVELLDRLVPDRPAYLESFDAHTGWANSRALAIAGASARGVLKESAMETVTRHIAAPTRDEDLDALRAGMRLAASRGIGSVQEAGDGQNQLSLWTHLRDAGELTLRVRLAYDLTPGFDADAYGEPPEESDGWVSAGILKAFADGVAESRTAAMLDPYTGSAERGTPLWDGDSLAVAVRAADRRGWQVQVHAIGDAAIRQALDAFEGTTRGRRHRVEHIETPDPSDLPRFARLGVVASMQPQHSDPALTEVWRRNIGPERAARGWPWRSLMQSGARLAFGTDWPVVPLDPLASVRIASRDLGIDAAIAAWTAGSAYAEHREREKGEVREGMLADLVVVDLDRSTVTATVVAGRVVYES